MKLDTSQADSYPSVLGYGNSFDPEDTSLPAECARAARGYLAEHPIDQWLPEGTPIKDAPPGEAVVNGHFWQLRRRMRDTMTRWLDEHDGVVDHWPDPFLMGSVTYREFDGKTGEQKVKRNFDFKLFTMDKDNGFTDFDMPAPPEKPKEYFKSELSYEDHYWDGYNGKEKEYNRKKAALADDRKTAEAMREKYRITPLKALGLLLLTYLALNGAVAFVYCFTGLFDYKALVDSLYGLTRTGSLPVKILVWPVLVLQYVNYFLFRNLMPLRSEGIFAIVIGYVLLLALLMIWLGLLSILHAFIFDPQHPFASKTAGGKRRIRALEKSFPRREEQLREMRKKLDGEKARLERDYKKDAAYEQCLQKDAEVNRQRQETYLRRRKTYEAMLETATVHRDMIRAYYRYLVDKGYDVEALTEEDWPIRLVPYDYDT